MDHYEERTIHEDPTLRLRFSTRAIIPSTVLAASSRLTSLPLVRFWSSFDVVCTLPNSRSMFLWDARNTLR